MSQLAQDLLDWYDRHHRLMPWRVTPDEKAQGEVADPYRVWLSEIMLQQTQVATVKAYFEKFVALWPTVEAMAAASEDDILKAWAGLGYYSRARNLKKCADTIIRDHGGQFPQTAKELQALPGIGPYTAAAIAAICHDEKIAVVDGNVERVFARLDRIATPLPDLKEIVREACTRKLPESRNGDFAQALMDLGATICTPKNPACSLCPLNGHCRAFEVGNMLSFPVKTPKKQKPTRKGAAFVFQREDGAILLEQRKEKGMLANMAQVPTTGWSVSGDGATGRQAAPFAANWQMKGIVRHTFTHFHLELEVWLATDDNRPDLDENQWWAAPETLSDEALPSLMRKVIGCGIPETIKVQGEKK